MKVISSTLHGAGLELLFKAMHEIVTSAGEVSIA
jgi:hypothetical protein